LLTGCSTPAPITFFAWWDVPLADADIRPLAGKRIVVTRAPEQARELIAMLETLGAEVFAFPLLEVLPVEDTLALDAAIRQLTQFDWLIFTSQNAVSFFVRRCGELGVKASDLSARTQIAAVGPATAKATGLAGYPVHFVSPEPHGLGLAAGLFPEVEGKRVLLPRSDRASNELPAALRKAGAGVLEVTAYRTVVSEEPQGELLQRISRREVDVITCASPSAFHRLGELMGMEALHSLAASVAFAAIGPTTADAIRRAGLPVAIEAERPSSAGFAAAIVKYYAPSSHARVTQP
jgi:uroporphyrinogen-III synthase